MTLSQLALEDMEALCSGSSFLMADPIGPLLDQGEEVLSPSSSLEVKVSASPSLAALSSSSPYQTVPFSPLSSSSPLTHSSSFLGTKSDADFLSLPLLGASDLLDTDVEADDGEGDAFKGLEWMSEKIDLSEFDLDSLIGSCSSDESLSSHEDLLASLDSHMDLNLDLSVQPNSPDLGLNMPEVPSPSVETPVNTEDVAPVQDVDMQSEPPSPAYTLELGSEVDVLEVEKMATTIIPNPSEIIQTTSPILLSLSTTSHFVVVLANKEQPPVISLPDQSINTSQSDCESDSGIESGAGSPAGHSTPPSSPTPGSSRTKPYSKPQLTVSPSPKASKVKSASGTPKVVEKKLKKMEQNKTAATRYRQKKRSEQELLNSELEELEKKNQELAEKAESISREIQYLKDLMEEVRKHHRGKTLSVA